MILHACGMFGSGVSPARGLAKAEPDVACAAIECPSTSRSKDGEDAVRSPEPSEIHEYSAAWVSEFQELGAQLREALGDVALRIDHIGSTSVEGLAAKPVIDLQISVRKLDPVDPFLEPMESLGYVWKKENPEKTKRYFREGSGRRRTHIHVRRAGL